MADKQKQDVPRAAYTVDEVVIATGLKRSRIYQAIRDKRLTVRKDGKQTIILVEELAAYLKALPIKGKEPNG